MNQSFYVWEDYDCSFELSGSEIIVTKPNTDTTNMFLNCSSLEINYVNGNVTTNTIRGAYVLFKNNLAEYQLKHRDFTLLNTSAVTSLDNLFKDEYNFNEEISQWNTEKVVSMKSTFQGAESFNKNINIWKM